MVSTGPRWTIDSRRDGVGGGGAETQNEKLARVRSLWTRASYSTNCLG
jgi:hypothetical protein